MLNHWLPLCVGVALTFTVYLLAYVASVFLRGTAVGRDDEVKWD